MNLTVTMTKPEKYFLAGYMLFELAPLPWLLQKLTALLPLTWTAGALNFLYFLLNFLAVCTISGHFLVKSLKNAVKTPEKLLTNGSIWFAVYWASTFTVSTVIFLIQPDFVNINDAAIAQILQTDPALMTIGTVLLVPTVEECLYRGFIFGTLHRRSRLGAYCLSIGLFSLVHIIGYIGVHPLPLLGLCLLQYIPAGLCLARAYEAADNIFAPILIHTTINAIGMIAMR